MFQKSSNTVKVKESPKLTWIKFFISKTLDYDQEEKDSAPIPVISLGTELQWPRRTNTMSVHYITFSQIRICSHANHHARLITSLIFSLFFLISVSSGSPPLTPTRCGTGTGGSTLVSFIFIAWATLLFSVWISACISSLDFLNFSFASSRAFSWSALILFLRRSSSSLWVKNK